MVVKVSVIASVGGFLVLLCSCQHNQSSLGGCFLYIKVKDVGVQTTVNVNVSLKPRI